MNFKKVIYRLTHWEAWHYNIKYVLLSPVGIWYSLRARSFYFFTPANPVLTFGGFEGGPKKEIYDLLPKETYPNSIYINTSWPLQKVQELMMENHLIFPVMPRVQVVRGFLFNHLYHHRGELVIHLRSTGNKVPGLYGPTYEESQRS